MCELVLASSSEFRKRQLESLGYQFRTIAPKIDESPRADEKPADLALRLAKTKASAVAQEFPQKIVIAGDQVGSLNTTLLSKPLVMDRAVKMLLSFREKTVYFFSAIAVLAPQRKMLSDVITTEVQFRDFERQEAIHYLQLDHPLDCAGAFKSEAHGSLLFQSVNSDDPSALIGLPLIRTADFLRTVGVNPLAPDAAKTHQNMSGLKL